MSRRLDRAEAVWTLTESANEPWFNLVNRYVFAPYFAGTLAASEGEGAAAWGFALGAAGLAIAILGPTLGSIADSGARLKPWLAGAGLMGFVASALLWFASPGVPLLPVALIVFLAIVGMELIVQFANALLPTAARPGRMGLLSGVAFGLSQLVGILVLLIVLGLSSLGPEAFGDIANPVDRLAGPIAAMAIALCILPFLLVGRDRSSSGPPSVMRGFADLRGTLAEAWRDRRMRRFLIGRMLAADGMAVVFGFGAVLAGLSFGWEAGTLAVFGLVITVFGAVGGFAAGWLDRRVGAHAILLTGLALLSGGTASVLATDAERLMGMATGVALGAPLTSPQEIGFLGSGAIIAVGAGFTISGMRTMMAILAPPRRIAAYFGLYAFVGKATAFLGPLLVGIVAQQTGSLRPGIAVALLFLLAGLALLAGVRPPEKGRLA